MARSTSLVAGLVLACALALAPAAAARPHRGSLSRIGHIVVIYEENHSFDNLYGGWERVDGVANADRRHTLQVDQAGRRYDCLLQVAVNLTSPPLPARCTDPAFPADTSSFFPNAPFASTTSSAPRTRPARRPGVSAANGVPKGQGLPGGCTRDLVHRFYQEQYQLDGGRQDRYVTGSDAVGLTMGTYDTRKLPIYRYLHAPGHPRYVIADRFFQAAFGGSFLNHQWLVAAATPTYPGAPAYLHSVLDANGMPTSYPLYTAAPGVKDTAITAACGGTTPAGLACWRLRGQHDPAALPAVLVAHRDEAAGPDARDDRRPPQRGGRRLGLVLGGLVERRRRRRGARLDERQRAHVLGPEHGDRGDIPELPRQALPVPPPAAELLQRRSRRNRGARRAPARRAGVRAARDLLAAVLQAQARLVHQADRGRERAPGVRERAHGLRPPRRSPAAVRSGRCRKDTMIVVTYDEFGGQWDHVPPPGQDGSPGPHDAMGPGTRIPALVLAPGLPGASRSTTSRTTRRRSSATVEHRFGLQPLTVP
jgi:phospholipase C